MSPLSLNGLASGIDTDSIISQLMGVERIPRNRLQVADVKAEARQKGLKDITSKLNAVRDAANALKSTTTWTNVQKLTTSDAARVAVRLDGSAAPGQRVLEVSALAVTAQHAYDYASSADPQTITIGSFSLAVDPDSNAATVAQALNDRQDSPVSAIVAGGKLVLTSRNGGAGGDFTVDPTPVMAEDATYARAGSDAAYTIDGAARTSSSNVITDAILGVEVTLKATTSSPVTIGVTDPGPDTEAIKAKVTKFVEAYNTAVDFVRGKVSEQRVKDPTTSTDAVKGLFNGDSLLSGALASMRSQIGDLSAYGISTGAVSTTGFSADAVAGKLKVDDAKLSAALSSDPSGLRTALDGVGQRMSDTVTPITGSRVKERLDGVAGERKRIADTIARTDVRLAEREKRLRAQFTAMESALAAGQAAQAQLSSQIQLMSR